jgi:hypothetical protein
LISTASIERWTPGEEPGPRLRLAWQTGRAGLVRVTGVDVLRVRNALALPALAHLDDSGSPLGPVLANRPRRCVEITVPAGTSLGWPDLAYTTCATGALMITPPPGATFALGRFVGGRAWFMPPNYGPTTTDPDDLFEAVTVALVRQASQVLRESQSPADCPKEGRA